MRKIVILIIIVLMTSCQPKRNENNILSVLPNDIEIEFEIGEDNNIGDWIKSSQSNYYKQKITSYFTVQDRINQKQIELNLIFYEDDSILTNFVYSKLRNYQYSSSILMDDTELNNDLSWRIIQFVDNEPMELIYYEDSETGKNKIYDAPIIFTYLIIKVEDGILFFEFEHNFQDYQYYGWMEINQVINSFEFIDV